MVANAMLAAMVEHACKPGLEVYQVASSVVNPLVFSNLARLSEEHFKEDPFLDNVGKPIETFKLQLYEDMDSFMEALSQLDLEFKVFSQMIVTSYIIPYIIYVYVIASHVDSRIR